MANLTAEQLKAIQDWYSGPMANAGTYNAGGTTYQQDANGIYGYNASNTAPGQGYDRYRADGTLMGQDKFQDPNKMDLGSLIALGVIGGGAAGLFSGGAGGMFGLGGSAPASQAGGSGAFLGEGAASGIPSWDMAGLSEMGLAGEGAFTGTNVLGGAATGSGIGGATAGAAAAGGGFLKSMGGLLGPAATLGGALLGAQGNKNEQTMTKTMDPRLDGPVYGTGGLIPNATNLMQQQMSPEGQAGWLEMQQRGRGLLGQPIAGNGFAQFAGRKL